MNKQELLEMNQAKIAEFRSNGGRISSVGGAPVLLLTTTGARTGRSRTTPLTYHVEELEPDIVYVFASYAGRDQNPDWYHNLVANPDAVLVEIAAESATASAEVLPERRRAELYAVHAGRYPGFADYQAKTKRRIPVVKLRLHR